MWKLSQTSQDHRGPKNAGRWDRENVRALSYVPVEAATKQGDGLTAWAALGIDVTA